jgi:hypothetical protein
LILFVTGPDTGDISSNITIFQALITFGFIFLRRPSRRGIRPAVKDGLTLSGALV